MDVVSGCPCQKSIFFAYNEVIWLLSPAFLAYGLRRLRDGTRLSAICDWTGRYPREWAEVKGSPRFWVHAVSVGEVVAASSVIDALKRKFQNAWVLVTTVTETGMRTARQRIRNANAFAFLPFDILPFPRWSMERVKPDVLILTETELWGNLMHSAKEIGAKVVLVNGRISDATFARSQSPLGKLAYQWLLSHLDLCLMRSEFDAQRILQMGMSPSPVRTIGDVKLDQPQIRLSETVKASLRSELGFFSEHLLFVAGSTHEGEEEIILRVYQRLINQSPNLRLLLAPRHLERVENVLSKVRSLGLTPIRRSECIGKPLRQNEVIVLDTVGELAKLYALATVAFVGGSLVQRGGHNIMEPILHGVPVLFGPHIDNFRPHAELLLREGIGFKVHDGDELVEVTHKLLASEPLRRTISWKAEQLLSHHRGAADRVAEAVEELLRK
ncbi:MAG: 3-deoxy-D-manno-octulosonic acid transferase [Candidatus Fervidibacter sp.]|uniref:3-deoxy-D-manno-octulosonic acid transferase n=1 Tax=Candidatus Fervidibacter sp. TaxID=3100871 RepID=UPI004048EDA5